MKTPKERAHECADAFRTWQAIVGDDGPGITEDQINVIEGYIWEVMRDTYEDAINVSNAAESAEELGGHAIWKRAMEVLGDEL